MKNFLITGSIAAMISLSACSQLVMPSLDMQGVDPQDYYEQNPIQNRVETRHFVHVLHFGAGDDLLMEEEADELVAAFGDISPDSIEKMAVFMHPGQIANEERKSQIARLLRKIGFLRKSQIRYQVDGDVPINEVRVDATYASVLLPHCPDWRKSPITNYSNTKHANIGCATTVNLGVQAADPRDFVNGQGSGELDAQRRSQYIRDYRNGKDAPAGGGSSASGGSSSGTP